MKIRIREDTHSFQITIPTRLVFSPAVLRLALRSKAKNLPPESVEVLSKEIRRIKKKHGAWELVEVKSADGEQVTIVL